MIMGNTEKQGGEGGGANFLRMDLLTDRISKIDVVKQVLDKIELLWGQTQLIRILLFLLFQSCL